MTLIIVNTIMSVIFITLSHPLSLGLTLLIQTGIISLLSGKFCYNFWFSYILFLVMVGGMLILFIYMTSVASNEKFTFSFKSALPMLSLVSCLIMPLTFMFFSDINITNNMTSFKTDNLYISMIKYTLLPSSITLMFTIIYLFITLIAIVKIINTKNGPLRTSN
uniref:NADH dehydrogenase subunit 6 n=1 Tax=Meloe mediterraneus TaxID=2781717 RepID=UPI001EDF9655|nr:NADH dehydrogenase subunit 6 [Meloe mediterraneus]UKE80246.1 NADH dehydrogenase subunit 6 [Meloe mediterraneus]